MERKVIWNKGWKYPMYQYYVPIEVSVTQGDLLWRLIKMTPPGYYKEDEEIPMYNTAKEAAEENSTTSNLQHILAGKLEYTNDLSQLIHILERCKNFLSKKDIEILTKFTMRGVYSSPGF